MIAINPLCFFVVALTAFLLHPNVVTSLQPSTTSQKSSTIFAQSSSASRDYIDRDSYWVYMFYLLMVYRDREGNCDVKYSHIEGGWKLGIWLGKQRESKKAGKLSAIYEQRLEEAGVVWDPCSKKWKNMFALLLRFKDREGHCNVAQIHHEDGECLGTWLMSQRVLWRDGTLPETRRRRLEEAGVVWNAQSNRWDEMYSLLFQYKARESHCRVPVKHKEEGKNLGSWLATQRKSYRANTLSSYRQALLEQLGVTWNFQTEQWNEMFKLLLRFKKREGHSQVPIDHKENDKNLGHWVAKQMQLHRSKTLDEIRRQQLIKAGVLKNL
jgi:hypothetical protein